MIISLEAIEMPNLLFSFFSKNSQLSSAKANPRHLTLSVTSGYPQSVRCFNSRETSMKLPIGQSDFRKIIDGQLNFVDKSLLIKDLIDDSAEAILITRPRRFGKTLNLSMLQHFFAAEIYGEATQGLFGNLKIAQQGQQYMSHQGKYSVISLSFKDIKEKTFTAAYESLCKLLSRVYLEHEKLLSSPKLTQQQKKIFESILDEKPSAATVKTALLDLTGYLHRHHGTKPVLLIDEYDTPLQTSYVHGYYDDMMEIMRYLLSAALKDNPNIYKAVLTGILRISKESLFSGPNNLAVYSLLRPGYGQYFGFTEAETDVLLAQSGLGHKAEAIKSWYNGYKMGNALVYNPWSIANCIKRNGELHPYWVNTSDNEVIKNSMIRTSAAFKTQFELLLQGRPVERIVDENFVFGDLETNESAIWSLLLFSGYLTAASAVLEGTKMKCALLPPNQEVAYLYQDIIQEWFTDRMGQGQYQY